MDTAQYKLLLDTAQVGWWEIDFDKRVYICSDYLVSLLELKDKIIPTRDFLQLIREDYRAGLPMNLLISGRSVFTNRYFRSRLVMALSLFVLKFASGRSNLPDVFMC